MIPWRRRSFWGLLVPGWIVTCIVLGLLIRWLGDIDGASEQEQIIAGLGMNAIGLAAGFEFARRHTSRSEGRGFDAITK